MDPPHGSLLCSLGPHYIRPPGSGRRQPRVTLTPTLYPLSPSPPHHTLTLTLVSTPPLPRHVPPSSSLFLAAYCLFGIPIMGLVVGRSAGLFVERRIAEKVNAELTQIHEGGELNTSCPPNLTLTLTFTFYSRSARPLLVG